MTDRKRGKAAEKQPWVPIPAGVGVATPSFVHKRFGRPSKTWTYQDQDDNILGFVHRYDPPYPDPGEADNDKKQIVPQTWNGKRWEFRGWDRPRPLYNLAALQRQPDCWAIVAEGEKAADAAGELVPSCVHTTASGGSNAFRHADWSPLYGCKGIILWPDADPVGIKLMQELAAHLAAHCPPGTPIKVINPHDAPEKGWDAADAQRDGWTPAKVQKWTKDGRIALYDGPRESTWVDQAPARPPEAAPLRAEPKAAEQPRNPFPDPVDLFSRRLLPVLDPEHLPRALRDIVTDQSEIIGSDPGILAMAALVTTAGCADDRYRLRMHRAGEQWEERPCLWGAWVGDPSVKKTPPVNRAFGPARKIDYRFGKESAALVADYKIQQKIYKECEAKHVRAAAKAAMEGGHVGDLVKAPEAPPQKRLIADDFTTEKLADLLKDNVRGMVMCYDELTEWFGSMDAYRSGGGGKDKALWLQLYNGGPRMIDRMSRETVLVPNWSVCLMGGIQPSAMLRIAKGLPEDGMLQRFMIVMAQEQEGIGVDRAENASAVQRYDAMLQRLATTEAPHKRPFTLSDEGIAERQALEYDLKGARKLANISPRVKSHLGKLDGLFGRLCLTYHLADAADRGYDPGPVVTGATAHAVSDFIRDYLVGHMAAFYDDLLDGGQHMEHARWIAGHILAHELDSIEHRTILRVYRAWKPMPDYARSAVMQSLEDAGWVYPIHGENIGRRVTRWEVNPRVFEVYGRQGEAERTRRDAAMAAIKHTGLYRSLTRGSGDA